MVVPRRCQKRFQLYVCSGIGAYYRVIGDCHPVEKPSNGFPTGMVAHSLSFSQCSEDQGGRAVKHNEEHPRVSLCTNPLFESERTFRYYSHPSQKRPSEP